jgi:putative salt-induced outer membrane protein YdiY
MNRFLAFIFSAFLLAQTGVASAEDWSPPEPMPDKFDWVQLTSGEWLKGEIKVMYDESMEFDSKKLGLLELDFGDIALIRSAQVVSARTVDKRIATGKLLVEDGKVTIIGDSTETFAKEDLLSITAGVPRERNFWMGKVTLGGNIRSGNTDQTEYGGSVHAQRRTVENRMTFDYLGSFSETEIDGQNTQTANNHRASAVWDYFLSPKWFLRPIFAEYYRDPFQNIAHRFTLGTGIGYQIIDTSKIDWQVFAGPSYQWTRYDETVAGSKSTDDSFSLTAGTTYRHELTDWVDFRYDYSFGLASDDAGGYNHHMLAGFAFDLVGNLNFDISMVWDRVQYPRPYPDPNDPNDPPRELTPEKDDYRLMFGLGYSF